MARPWQGQVVVPPTGAGTAWTAPPSPPGRAARPTCWRCRRPGSGEPGRTREGDIDEIARRFAADSEALARILKEAGAAR